MEYTGERVVPGVDCGVVVVHHHVMRYAWAMPFVYGRRTVDLGCGCGYGAFLLSLWAAEVVGVDVDEGAIAFAREHFRSDNLRYVVGDVAGAGATHWGKCVAPERPAEGYVAFEILEHLEEPERLLERYRPLAWSMPINDGSEFHERAYTLAEIEALTGDVGWLQARTGEIVRREVAWFEPMYALGVVGMGVRGREECGGMGVWGDGSVGVEDSVDLPGGAV